jgi:hypothetical protein
MKVHTQFLLLPLIFAKQLMFSLPSGGFFGVETAPSVQKELSDQVDSVAIIAFKAVVTLTQGRVVPIIELSTLSIYCSIFWIHCCVISFFTITSSFSCHLLIYFPSHCILCVVYHENSRFLLDIKDQSQIETWEFVDQRKLRKKETELAKAGHLRNPLYTSGNVFYVSLFDTLICQVICHPLHHVSPESSFV